MISPSVVVQRPDSVRIGDTIRFVVGPPRPNHWYLLILGTVVVGLLGALWLAARREGVRPTFARYRLPSVKRRRFYFHLRPWALLAVEAAAFLVVLGTWWYQTTSMQHYQDATNALQDDWWQITAQTAPALATADAVLDLAVMNSKASPHDTVRRQLEPYQLAWSDAAVRGAWAKTVLAFMTWDVPLRYSLSPLKPAGDWRLDRAFFLHDSIYHAAYDPLEMSSGAVNTDGLGPLGAGEVDQRILFLRADLLEIRDMLSDKLTAKRDDVSTRYRILYTLGAMMFVLAKVGSARNSRKAATG